MHASIAVINVDQLAVIEQGFSKGEVVVFGLNFLSTESSGRFPRNHKIPSNLYLMINTLFRNIWGVSRTPNLRRLKKLVLMHKLLVVAIVDLNYLWMKLTQFTCL